MKGNEAGYGMDIVKSNKTSKHSKYICSILVFSVSSVTIKPSDRFQNYKTAHFSIHADFFEYFKQVNF